ncbi:sodium-hydrogen antiporter [Cadophora sp. MPI-SDFR-AT-0126]|nr:sodium-hydrogen antiporter [Leotiomycetes sp. MPI-SDFR-AT-0126]
MAPIADLSNAPTEGFLEYHEPKIVPLLVLISFFFFLAVAEWISDKIFRASLIGQIVVGLIYGLPVGNIMPLDWQDTFVSLGYIGLVLIIFEGVLTVRLDLIRKNFWLSLFAASVGVMIPIALCMFSSIWALDMCSKKFRFLPVKVGTVLISVAVFDDVSGLVMASVIHNFGGLAGGAGGNLRWLIGRPIVAAIAMGILSPLSATYLFGPLFRWYVEHRFIRFKHVSNVILMVLVLSAFLSIASFACASVLYRSFLAGTFLSSLPCTHPKAPFVVMSRERGETDPGTTPTFVHTFEKYFLGAQTYVLQPMFFANIGFAIPFKKLWTAQAFWKGLVFSILMVIGKALAALLGMEMVAHGDIGILITQIGLNQTPFMSETAFITAAWAIVLNTIIGPVGVGVLLGKLGKQICDDPRWGTQSIETEETVDKSSSSMEEVKPGRKWTSRRHSRSVSFATSSRDPSRGRSAYHSCAPSEVRTGQYQKQEGVIANDVAPADQDILDDP